MRLGPSTSAHLGDQLHDGALELVVPIGATEQHGPHLPLDTDTRVAVAVAERLAARRPGLAVAPALPVSASGEHAGFPGTLSIGNEALELVAVELARSADAFAGVAFVSGHGGNAAPLRRAVDRLAAEGRRALAWWPRLAGTGCDAHAGYAETSLVLALAPDLVRLERAEAGATAPLGELWERLARDGVAAVSPNGVLGDPTGASAAAGRQLLERLVADAAAAVDAWRAARASAREEAVRT